MCVVSMVMDHYREKWIPLVPSDPWTQPYTWPIQPEPNKPIDVGELAKLLKPQTPAITPEEIAEFRRLLERAREYDKRHNEPDCELDSKKQTLLDLAKQLGVEINFL